ncbi:hypothetical protein HRV97_06100 [Sphingomonas sp. HHU CXW]|uniref:Cell envelope biogenesis protein TolA n=1 Tax=Sphingomonas hominis TaxID=2741495 RepID=A0ABX2JGP1_9SPHN|nr:hypothetical protein [Sphingomonas hominis]NTS64726.1 hypothetical protein [Sphingomonas hominis]
MARKLKVFRTAAGFHDAYVAAPSRKAALAAWGAERDLFAHGAAEEVTDPALMKEPLAHPGEVIKRSRGSAAEQFAALPADAPKPKRAAKARAAEADPAAKPAPKPSRDALDAAQDAVDAAERDWRKVQRGLAARQAALDRERREATERHEQALADLERTRRRAQEAYNAGLAAWREAR